VDKEALPVENKAFELLEKMYVEFSEFRKETNTRLDKVEGHIIRIENDHGQKFDALFDGYRQLAEGQEEIKSQLAELSSKVEKQDIQITVLKGNKKAVK
jgi:transcriptional regulator of heat shock response